MKIGEILELTQVEPLPTIAKERLGFGEAKARMALKLAGCYSIIGKRGWFLSEGTDESVLEQSVYDFVPATKQKAAATNRTKERSNVVAERGKEQVKQANQQTAPTIERTNVVRKRSSFDIDIELMKELKIQAIVHDRTVYEIVETAVRHYLAELKGK